MKKRHALILSLIITGIIASEMILFSLGSSERESVVISRVIDGDTLVLADGRHLRLLNINAPEKDMPDNEQSRYFMEQFVNKTVYIESAGLDKYQRSLARVYSADSDYLNLHLVRDGLASKFLVDSSELKEFNSAEEEAISSEKGIWKHSAYFGCFSANINEKKEVVDMLFLCNVFTEGWYLKDESRKVYKFGKSLRGEVFLFSSDGISNSTALYWNQGNVWNNDRDTLYLFDREGKIIFHISYGY